MAKATRRPGGWHAPAEERTSAEIVEKMIWKIEDHIWQRSHSARVNMRR
jgi:hypothetical protein